MSIDPQRAAEVARGIEREQRVHALTSRQELFARRSVEPVIDVRSLARLESAWAGIGLSSGTASEGIPIDVMVLVYAQEMVRRELGCEESVLLVADANALADGVDELSVRRARRTAERVLTTLVTALRFPVRLIRATELEPEVRPLLGSIHGVNGYVARQVAQTEVLRRRGHGVKVGWTLSSMTRDERFFDALYEHRIGGPMSFVYTTGGRSLDPTRPRANPYLVRDPARRVLLGRHEPVRDKLAAAPPHAARGYARLLGKLARAHHRLTGERFRSAVGLAEHLVAITR